MSDGAIQKIDWLNILFIMFVAVCLYCPVFYTEYAYTDELVGLSQFGKGNSHSLLVYGRWITEKLAEWLFGRATTIRQLSVIRLFSLGGWMLSIPVWYFVIKKVAAREKLPVILAFFSTLYLVCTPPVSIYVGWAACFELFLANTAGLVSGYFFYAAARCFHERRSLSAGYLVASVMAGIVSLFTYQNGFGCFLLPFLLYLLSGSREWRFIFIGIAGYFFISVVYYFLFKYSVAISHLAATDRTTLHINVLNKLKFFFSRPLNSAFHFTFLINEKSIPGVIGYALMFGTWLAFFLFQRKRRPFPERVKYVIMVFFFFGLIYLPSLVVQENYASNRTLLALDMAVFLLAAQAMLTAIGFAGVKRYAVGFLSFLFIINAWYNFNRQFLGPVKKEYAELRNFIEYNYRADADTVYFIRPAEDFFVRKYGITRSWDEFGVPSTFFEWTPDFLVRQIVFEKTGSRSAADKLVIRNWLGKDAFLKSGVPVSQRTLIIDAEKIMSAE